MKDDILALTKLKRSRPNLDRINDQLSEARELADAADDAIAAAQTLHEAINELCNADGSGNPFTPWFDDAVEAAETFQQSLPSEDAGDLGELVSEAEGAAEEYESCLDDHDYSADDRQEVWDNLMDALTNLADAM